MQKASENAINLCILTAGTLLLAHLCACAWIHLGKMSEDSWINVQKATGDEVWATYGMSHIYILSLYWICTVLTTVGYGDFSGTTYEELGFSMFLEFGGLLLFATLTGLIGQYVEPFETYEDSLTKYVEDCNLWSMKLSDAGKSPLSPELYQKISIYTEDAFKHDFNLIIEQADFYLNLAPRD